jgi:hypothetical protein
MAFVPVGDVDRACRFDEGTLGDTVEGGGAMLTGCGTGCGWPGSWAMIAGPPRFWDSWFP